MNGAGATGVGQTGAEKNGAGQNEADQDGTGQNRAGLYTVQGKAKQGLVEWDRTKRGGRAKRCRAGMNRAGMNGAGHFIKYHIEFQST